MATEIRYHNFAAENCRVSCWAWRLRGIVCAPCARRQGTA